MKRKKISHFLLLHVALLIYSGCSVISKIASSTEMFSMGFMILYGCMLFGLVVYAVLWQQVLKHIPLSIAFANKSVVILWGILWGVLLFNEVVTWNMLVGAVIIGIGVFLVGCKDE